MEESITNISQEFLTDFLFFVLFLFYELFFDVTHWAPVGLHIVTSLVAGLLAASFVKKDIFLRCAAAILTGVCCASTAVCDFVFLTNYVTREDELVATVVTVSTFVIAFGGACYRTYCAGEYFNTGASMVATGVAFATTMYYLIWLVFFGERATMRALEIPDGSLTSGNWTAMPIDPEIWKDVNDHWIRQYTIFIFGFSVAKGAIFFIKNFSPPSKRKSEFFWLASSLFLFLDYMVLLGNISPVIGEENEITFFSHGLQSTRAQVEGIFLSVLMAGAQSIIVFDATPSTHALLALSKNNNKTNETKRVKTVALLATSEPFAAILQFLYTACFASLPLLCTVGVTLAGDLTPTERLLLSLYAVHLSFRYWVQLKTARYGVFCSVSFIGMSFDVAVLGAITLETIQAPILAILHAFNITLTAVECKATRTVFLTCVTTDVQVIFGVVATVSLLSTLIGVLYGAVLAFEMKTK